MAAGYNPIAVESLATCYDWWIAQGFFKPEYKFPFAKDEICYTQMSPAVYI